MMLKEPLIEIGQIPGPGFELILDSTKSLTFKDWVADTSRQDSFRCHQSTQAIPLIYGRNMNNLVHTDAWKNNWREVLFPVLTPILRDFYGDGEIMRMCLCKLLPMSKVLEHKDDTEEILLHTHRIHLPIISNDLVDFVIEGECFNLKIKYLYEFSNQQFHYVENRSEIDRVHLIFDYMDRDKLNLFKEKHHSSSPVSWPTSYRDLKSGEMSSGES